MDVEKKKMQVRTLGAQCLYALRKNSLDSLAKYFHFIELRRKSFGEYEKSVAKAVLLDNAGDLAARYNTTKEHVTSFIERLYEGVQAEDLLGYEAVPTTALYPFLAKEEAV
jgi:hypothetical protein